MFGKKENNTTPPPVITARIETMPGAFYAGSDPVIYPDQSEKTAASILVKKPVLAAKPPQAAAVTPSASLTPKPGVQAPKAALQKPLQKPAAGSKKMIFILLALLVLLGIGALVYFMVLAPKDTNTNSPSTLTSVVPFQASPIVTLPVVTSTAPIEIVSSTPSSTPIVRGGGSLILPHLSYAPSKDSDADTLTNLEEEIFLSDPEVYDTDRDGYYDGQEVANLYNPKGIAPQKIIDSGLVKEYINPTYQYRFYYPSSWRVDPVANDLQDVLLSADSGDYMEIRVFPKDEGMSFASWFASNLPGENFTAFSSFQNRFQVTGYRRGDNQVGFFETPKFIYSVVYFYGEQEKNAFPHIMNVLLQSFRSGKTNIEIPAQIILPGVSTNTLTSTLSNVLSTNSSTVSSTL